jgi:hypothetical protein
MSKTDPEPNLYKYFSRKLLKHLLSGNDLGT